MGEGDGTPAERVATGNGWVNGVFMGRGMPSGTTNPSEATLMQWSRGSLALITHLGAWNVQEMGVYPRIRCAALSWPSASLMYTSDCRILSKLALLTKQSKGVVELGSTKPLKPRKVHFSNSEEQGYWKNCIS